MSNNPGHELDDFVTRIVSQCAHTQFLGVFGTGNRCAPNLPGVFREAIGASNEYR